MHLTYREHWMPTLDEDGLQESANPLRFGVQSRDFIENDLQDDDSEPIAEAVEERADHTDDPVRVYLREMGSVRLLNKQAEIDLARRMERGSLRAQKALSRSLLIRKLALTRYEEVLAGKARIEDLVIIGGTEEAAKRRIRAKAMQLFKKLAELDHDLSRLQ